MGITCYIWAVDEDIADASYDSFLSSYDFNSLCAILAGHVCSGKKGFIVQRVGDLYWYSLSCEDSTK